MDKGADQSHYKHKISTWPT